MSKRRYRTGLVLIVVTMGLALVAYSEATTAGFSLDLPPCGSDPRANTRMLQEAIDNAGPGSTLVLRPGVCVVAKCDIAQGAPCVGVAGRHDSALYMGKKSNLTLVGAADGTSVLKLDPNPPRRSDGFHAYCRDTHLLSIQGSSFITLRDFTVDGSDGELPEDTNQCPGNDGKIAEHMHVVYLRNSTDVTINRMKIIKAHGDGLNLIANKKDIEDTGIPRTERISVTNTKFLANDRSGFGFQRNVGHVTVRGNYFKNSGDDQDLDMEPSGGEDNLRDVEIDNNLFERTKPRLTVTLGSGGEQRSNGVRFTNNTIRPASSSEKEAGCIQIIGADNTTIANNTVIGAQRCVTLFAQKVSGLRLNNNRLEGYTNQQDKGNFVPKPVIGVSERIVSQKDPTCGHPNQPPCPRFIHYSDGITIKGNTIIQHVQYSIGIELSNVDKVALADNNISHADDVPPAGEFDPDDDRFRPRGIRLPFGVPDLQGGAQYLNEKKEFQVWSITGNRLNQFANGITIAPKKADVTLSSVAVNGNVFNTAQRSPRGIWLVGASTAPDNAFINSLRVDSNAFGCGFQTADPPPVPPAPHAFVRPQGQAHTGNIGFTVVCAPTAPSANR
jgi:hypothetical protein